MGFLLSSSPVFHVTTVLHNSRVSIRVIDFCVQTGDVLCLELREEEQLIRICCSVIKGDKLRVSALNFCGDHLHMLIHCDKTQLPHIMRQFKSKSARAFNIWLGLTEIRSLEREMVPVPLTRGVTQNNLWAQKYNAVEINNYRQMSNVITYIKNNRMRHRFPAFPDDIRALINSVIVEF